MNDKNVATAVSAEQPGFTERLSTDGMPNGFLAAEGGIYELGDDKADPLWLCSPITVKAKFRRATGGGWGRIIEILDPDGRRQEAVVFDAEIEAKPGKVRSGLADRGVRFRGDAAAKSTILRLIRDWQPTSVLTSTDRIGWTDDTCTTFIQSDGCALGDGRHHYTGSGFDGILLGHSRLGTQHAWRENVAALCIGNPLLTLSVSLAFAGPLLEFLGEEGGGIHLRGASSCGKTTIQKVAASVWGNPSRVGTWRVTANGVEEVARACNSTLLALDEIAEISAKDLGNAAYMLANGMGKARGSATGSSIPRAAWRVGILSTGEISVADKLAEGGQKAKAGHDVRLLDIEADSGLYGAFDNLHGSSTGAEFAHRLKRAAFGAHGTAGPAFVEHLMTDQASRRQKAQQITQKIHELLLCKLSVTDDGQLLRVARRLAVIACAGEMATTAGLTGWPKRDAINAAQAAFSLWLEARQPWRFDDPSAAVDLTRSFLKSNAGAFVVQDKIGAAIQSATYGWRLTGGFLISQESWRALHGERATDAARELMQLGLLVPGEGKHVAKRAPRWVEGRPRGYLVRAAILQDRPMDATDAAA